MLAQKNGAIGVILYSDPFDFAPEAQLNNQVFIIDLLHKETVLT